MPHLHLSLQSGDDMILKRMKRRHSRADALAIVDKLRALRPDMVFGADIIAGFPTETDAMFENTFDFVTEADLTYLHVFPFSPREGTPAARMPQVAKPIAKERAARLRALGESQFAKLCASRVGQTETVLVERETIGAHRAVHAGQRCTGAASRRDRLRSESPAWTADGPGSANRYREAA